MWQRTLNKGIVEPTLAGFRHTIDAMGHRFVLSFVSDEFKFSPEQYKELLSRWLNSIMEVLREYGVKI